MWHKCLQQRRYNETTGHDGGQSGTQPGGGPWPQEQEKRRKNSSIPRPLREVIITCVRALATAEWNGAEHM